jgi:GTP-binding protein EngB required for normal cell division
LSELRKAALDEETARTAPKSRVREDPLARLEALSFLASSAGCLKASQEASLLAARTERGLFYVACVGQFKRGKSTLLNALLGEPILPSGVIPVTSIVTVVRHGTARRARIRFDSGEWRDIDASSLSRFISESGNPENREGVLAAEVLLPHALLASGLCLVDTPGLGSAFEANSAATRSFIPHIDAALVVLGADPPISGEEIGLIQEISRTVRRFLFVLNKADRLPDEERREARRFTERLLETRLGRPSGEILEVSATESLASGQPTRDLPELAGALATLAREAGADLVREAQERGIARISARILQELDEQQSALRRPVEDSQHRIEALRRSVSDAERAAGDLAHLFLAEQERLSAVFGRERRAFLDREGPEAARRLEAAIAARRDDRRSLRAGAAARAREIAKASLEGWLRKVEPLAEERYRSAVQRFVELSNDFFDRLSRTDPSFGSLADRKMESERGFRTERRFYFNDLFELDPSASVLRIADLARSMERAEAAALRESSEYLEKLLEHNSTRVVNDLDERVLESRRRLEAEILDRLREGLDSAVHALDRARARQAEGSEAVGRELARIEDLRDRVRALTASRPPAN